MSQTFIKNTKNEDAAIRPTYIKFLLTFICFVFSVTLRAAPNDYFRGFFVQATRADFPLEAINRPAYGTFRPLDANSQARRCRAAVGGVGGITHTNNRDKNVVSFDWYPPASCNLGNVQFV